MPNVNWKRLNCFSCLTGSRHKYFTKIERIFNICKKLAKLRTKIENSPQPQVRNLNCQSPQVRMSATFFVSPQLRTCGLAQLCDWCSMLMLSWSSKKWMAAVAESLLRNVLVNQTMRILCF